MTPDGAATGRLTGEGLAHARPPGSFAPVAAWVLDSTEQLSALRVGIFRELAGGAGDPAAVLEHVADDMVLIATELATNAIEFGLPPTEVTLLQSDGLYLLDIADHDPGTVPQVAGARAPGRGGFGLRIAQRLAVDVGWYADGDVKHVWAILPVPAR